MLPKLGEILAVSIDELLKGQSDKSVEIVDSKYKNNFILMANIVFLYLVFSSIVSVITAYSVNKPVWPFFINLISIFISVVIYLVFRNNYLSSEPYNNEMKKTIYKKTESIMLGISISIATYLPILIGYIMLQTQPIYIIGVIIFRDYLIIFLVISLLFLLLWLLISYIHYQLVYKDEESESFIKKGILYKKRQQIVITVSLILFSILQYLDYKLIMLFVYVIAVISVLFLVYKKINLFKFILSILFTIVITLTLSQTISLKVMTIITALVLMVGLIEYIVMFKNNYRIVNVIFFTALLGLGFSILITITRDGVNFVTQNQGWLSTIAITSLFIITWLPISKTNQQKSLQ